MKCRHCGARHSLVETTFRDEDGLLYTDWLDICVYCEEIEIERSQQRREWNAYHEEHKQVITVVERGACSHERTSVTFRHRGLVFDGMWCLPCRDVVDVQGTPEMTAETVE